MSINELAAAFVPGQDAVYFLPKFGGVGKYAGMVHSIIFGVSDGQIFARFQIAPTILKSPLSVSDVVVSETDFAVSTRARVETRVAQALIGLEQENTDYSLAGLGEVMAHDLFTQEFLNENLVPNIRIRL